MTNSTQLKLEMETAYGWAMSCLNERERMVIQKRIAYEESKSTYDQIAKECGCTRARIRQIEHKSLSKIRLFFNYPNGNGYGLEMKLLIEELNRINTFPSRSRSSLPWDCRYIPYVNTLFRPKIYRSSESKKSTKLPGKLRGVLDYKQPKQKQYKSNPNIDGVPCVELSKTFVARVRNVKYVHFKQRKRFQVYQALEKNLWVRDNEGRYFNPKVSQVRSIMFRECLWKSGWVWMCVTFSSSF